MAAKAEAARKKAAQRAKMLETKEKQKAKARKAAKQRMPMQVMVVFLCALASQRPAQRKISRLRTRVGTHAHAHALYSDANLPSCHKRQQTAPARYTDQRACYASASPCPFVSLDPFQVQLASTCAA